MDCFSLYQESIGWFWFSSYCLPYVLLTVKANERETQSHCLSSLCHRQNLTLITVSLSAKQCQILVLGQHQDPVVRRLIALNPGLNLTRVSFPHVQKHFLFSDIFLCNF